MIPANLNECTELGYLQCVGLIALYALQVGNVGLLHKHMGLYHALVAQGGLQDENRWPNSLRNAERAVRRRLFWSMYRLEVHTALVMGHLIRCPESQCAVLYPSTSEAANVGSFQSSADESVWLSGWNHITDLYRILEHAVNAFRAGRTHMRSRTLPSLPSLSAHDVLRELDTLQDSLPNRFRQALHQSESVDRNRCGFQVANIVATVQVRRNRLTLADFY